MRAGSILALLLIAACKPAPSTGADAQDAVQAGTSVPASEPETSRTIPCALGGAQAFAQCRGELTPDGDRRLAVVRHPDGGFRRFEFVDDGRGIVTADGAEAARVELQGGIVEVTVGDDRYRFPAK